jgi:bifunctional ADP-heptose synthase (sugar kinase/adenylyltransferase)
VARLKGAGRPLFNTEERAKALLALACVRAVHVGFEDDFCHMIRQLKPDILCVGNECLPGKRECLERDLMEMMGRQVYYIPRIGDYSTTRIIEARNGITVKN